MTAQNPSQDNNDQDTVKVGKITTPDPMVGKTLSGRYEILSVLGKGGMGVVYKGRRDIIDRYVAIKVLKAGWLEDETTRKRFELEAKAAAKLNHPHLISVYDYGFDDDGDPYLVMDFLEGKSLEDLIAKEKFLPLGRVLKIFQETCKALNYIHKQGIIHRDLKPSNIMLVLTDDDPDFVKLVDFGIAKILPQEGEGTVQRLTVTGQSFGSPLYMSPEQCMGGTIDARSDVYALGCVMFEMMTGTPPIQGENALQTLFAHVNKEPISFADANKSISIPEEMQRVILKALAKDPKDRFQSAQEFGEALAKPMSGSQGTISGLADSASTETANGAVSKQKDDTVTGDESPTGAGVKSGALTQDVDTVNSGNAIAGRVTDSITTAGSASLRNGSASNTRTVDLHLQDADGKKKSTDDDKNRSDKQKKQEVSRTKSNLMVAGFVAVLFFILFFPPVQLLRRMDEAEFGSQLAKADQLLKEKKYKEAASAFDEVNAKAKGLFNLNDVRFAEIDFKLGQIHQGMENYSLAQDEYERALKKQLLIDPGSPRVQEIQWHLGEAYLKSAKYKEAKEYLDSALKYYDEHQTDKDALSSIKESKAIVDAQIKPSETTDVTDVLDSTNKVMKSLPGFVHDIQSGAKDIEKDAQKLKDYGDSLSNFSDAFSVEKSESQTPKLRDFQTKLGRFSRLSTDSPSSLNRKEMIEKRKLDIKEEYADYFRRRNLRLNDQTN